MRSLILWCQMFSISQSIKCGQLMDCCSIFLLSLFGKHCRNARAHDSLNLYSIVTVVQKLLAFYWGQACGTFLLWRSLWPRSTIRGIRVFHPSVTSCCFVCCERWWEPSLPGSSLVVICWLLNVPATCKYISGMDLLKYIACAATLRQKLQIKLASTKTECDYLSGWIRRNTYAKNVIPKWWPPEI